VLADVPAVESEGVRRAVELVKVSGQKLVDGRRRPRVPLLGDLMQQSVPDLLGLTPCLGAGRNNLDQVVALLRDGVDASVDPDPQRAAP
jgi:hypothetical protein